MTARPRRTIRPPSPVSTSKPRPLGHWFRGQADSPAQFGTANGDLEMQPHDVVHSASRRADGRHRHVGAGPDLLAASLPISTGCGTSGSRRAAVAQTRPTAPGCNTTFTFYDEAGHAVYLTGAEIVYTVGQLNYRYDDDPMPQLGQIIIIAEGAAREATKLEAKPATVRNTFDRSRTRCVAQDQARA